MIKKIPLFALCSLLAFGTASLADARPGGGHSFGSRGSRTYTPPPPTRTTPYGAQPMEQSLAPRGPAYIQGQPGGFGAPRFGYGSRHPFLTGLAGGFLGAGLFGLLSGHGFFGGLHAGLGIFGFLIQVLIIGLVISFFLRRRRPTSSGTPGVAGTITITNSDYQAFQRLLIDIQAAWSARNLRALSTMVTPEMIAQFNDQLSDLASRGARNIVSDVQFQQGDLSEAWREGNREYATVAMRFSMIDVTTDMAGNVIDGSGTERISVAEFWTFLRTQGRGSWVLSAIQQAR